MTSLIRSLVETSSARSAAPKLKRPAAGKPGTIAGVVRGGGSRGFWEGDKPASVTAWKQARGDGGDDQNVNFGVKLTADGLARGKIRAARLQIYRWWRPPGRSIP